MEVFKDHSGGGLDFILSMMRSHWKTVSKETSLSGLYIEKIALAGCDHTKATGHHLSCRSTYDATDCPSLRVLYLLV